MSQPYVGEIRMFAGNFAPAGWMFCEGQLLPISEFDTLFNLIGTTYGGDGQSTFGLPDLRGRIPVHVGTGAGSTYTLAQTGGAETVTLNINTIPAHSHPLVASTNTAQTASVSNNVTGATNSSANQFYRQATPAQPMAPNSIGSTGGSQPHDNFQPYLCIDFIISLFGVYPSPT
jgi:microcystin-dependent protein